MSTEGFEQVSGKEPLTRTVSRKPVSFVPQLTPTDCGAACLASVLALFGKHVPIHEVRTVLGGGRNGVTAKQLLIAARSFGLSARGVAIEPKKLKYLPPGSILHWDLAHFVVYENSTSKHVNIVDPGAGKRRVSMEDAAKSITGIALVFEPGHDFVRQAPTRRVRFRRYTDWIFSVRNVWGRILLTSFFLQIIALAIPGLTAIMIDKVVPRSDMQLLYLVAAGFLMIASFQFLAILLRARLLLALRTKVEARMSFDFVEHLFALPYSFFQQRTTGDLLMRMSSQVAIREVLTSGALSAVLDGLLVSLYFVLLLGAAPLLALVALGFAGLQVAICLFASRRNSRLVIESLAAQSQLAAYQVEMLSGIEVVKSMGATDRTFSRWSDLYVNTLNRSITRERLEGSFGSVLGVLRFGGPACLLLAGAHQVVDGSLSLGTMLGLSSLGSGFLDPVSNLVGTAMKLSQLRAYMERIEDVLETPPESRRSATEQGRQAAAMFSGSIHVSELSFKYPSEPKPTLQNIAFTADPGECIAIVGPSGSGKSTLARLLAGLYEPLTGSIAFDGRDLRSWDLHALREKLGIVTQDTRLFSGTIRDNVSLFDPTIPLEEVEVACRRACLAEAIAQMPMGYDTVLADGGSSLSGGQRQRLSLARALARKPRILILDEATSALDVITERAVQANLREIHCTRVIVAHRLSTVVDADKIMVLEQGKLVGIGRHDELLSRCPTYCDLVHSQSEQQGASTLLAADRAAQTPAPVSAPAPVPARAPVPVSVPVTSRAPSPAPNYTTAPAPTHTPAPVLPPTPKFRPRRGQTATLVSLSGDSQIGASLKEIIDAHVAQLPIGARPPARGPASFPQPTAANPPARSTTRAPEPASAPVPAPPAAHPPSVTVRTTLSIADEPKSKTSAAADDGTRVKWGKPNS